MGSLSKSYKPVILLLSLLASSPAALADSQLSPLILNARYDIAWSGIPLGRIRIEATEDATSYHMTIDTKTKGFGALISDEKRIISGAGRKSAEGNYLASSYTAKPQQDKIDRVVTLTYNAEGKIVSRSREPDDDPAWRPLVPNKEIDTAHDPISTVFELRKQLYHAVQLSQPEIGTRMYDGARLMDMKLIRSMTDTRVAVMGGYKETINVGVQRTPIDGYTPKELKKYKKGDPELRIYFSADDTFIPVRATAKTAVGELSMTLVEINK